MASPMESIKIIELARVTPSDSSITEFSLPLTFFDTLWIKFPPNERVIFYQLTNPTHDFFNSTILPELKRSLSITLNHYVPLAGNIVWNSTDSKPIILYKAPNDAVSLTVAESNSDMSHLSGNTIRRAIEYHPLVPELSVSDRKASNISLQVTFFNRQGFSIGVTSHHAVVDGKTLSMFIKSWAYICNHFVQQNGVKVDVVRHLPDDLVPFFDRSAIKNPVMGLDMKLLNLRMGRDGSDLSKGNLKLLPVREVDPNLVRYTFVLTRLDIEKLRGKVDIKKVRLSTFVLAFSYVLLCMIKTKGGGGDDGGRGENGGHDEEGGGENGSGKRADEDGGGEGDEGSGGEDDGGGRGSGGGGGGENGGRCRGAGDGDGGREGGGEDGGGGGGEESDRGRGGGENGGEGVGKDDDDGGGTGEDGDVGKGGAGEDDEEGEGDGGEGNGGEDCGGGGSGSEDGGGGRGGEDGRNGGGEGGGGGGGEGGGGGSDDLCFVFAADFRRRLDPRLPSNYFGNCVMGCATTSKSENFMKEDGLVFATNKVSDVVSSLSSDMLETMYEAVKLIATFRGRCHFYTVAGSNRFGVYGADFGWGRPVKIEILSIDRTGAIAMSDCRDEHGGVEIGVSLTPRELEVFSNVYLNGLNDK